MSRDKIIFVSLHGKIIVWKMSCDFQIFFSQIHNDLLIASEKQHVTQWEDFMKEQHSKQAEVDEEHRKAVEKLREQYTEMEKGLARFSTFWEREPQQWRTNEKKLTFPPQKKNLPPNHLASASSLAIYSMALFCRKMEPSPGGFPVS